MRLLKSYAIAAMAFLALAVIPFSAANAGMAVWTSKNGDVWVGSLNQSPNGSTSSPVSASQLTLDTGTKTATAAGTTTATATLNKKSGKITSASLTTAAAGTYVLTLTNSQITAASMVFASVATGGTGMPAVANVVPGSNQVVITIKNIDAAAAFNNTIVISFQVLQP